VTLTGLLADGSPFSFELNSDSTFGFVGGTGGGLTGGGLTGGLDPSVDEENDFFDPDMTLTVTLVTAVGDVLLGDADQDGEVTFSDITPFVAVLQSGTFLTEADCNQDGEVNFADIPRFIEILQGT